MALQLFAHNAKAYQAAVDMMDVYGKAAIVHPTGTGKSYIAFKLIEDHPDAVILWLSPSEYIYKTQQESLLRQNPDFQIQNVHFYTYAKLMYLSQEQMEEIAALNSEYIILDEFHRAGAEQWGDSTLKLLALCPHAKLLGLTATNVRYLDNNRDMAEELFDGHVASEMTLGEAIVRGILPAPKYVTTVFKYQQDLARYQSRVDGLRSPGIQDVNQNYLDALKRALEQADGLDKVFAHHITNKSGKYIVFCSGKEHMDEMVSYVPEWFASIDPNPTIYKALSDDPSVDKAFAEFKADNSDHLKLLFCIDMLNEGVHVEGISGVILFRPTVSPIIYKQQIGRALTAGDSATPLILDVVNNFDGLSSISGLQNEMAAAVRYMYANGEGDKIVTDRFEVVEQVHDCRVLFAKLQKSLSSSWDHYFSEASIYYAEHGDLEVPKKYKTPTGLSLGAWIQLQKRNRIGKGSGTLTLQQIERLDSIGMVWENRVEVAYEKGYAAAKEYYEEHGNLEVPVQYKCSDGLPLGIWLSNRRTERITGRLSEEQIKRLGEIGMVWSMFDKRWERAYLAAENYFARHGNLAVSHTYVDEEGFPLGRWIEAQKHAHRAGTLAPSRVEQLSVIGINWLSRKETQWNRAYAAARQYYEAHGNLEVPTSYVTPDGVALGKWVARMRYTRSNPSKSNSVLTDERIEKLNALEMQWEKPDPWQHRFELAEEYLKVNGNLQIPAKYKSEDGIWLGTWLYRQRGLIREQSPKLSTEQVEKLQKLLNEG